MKNIYLLILSYLLLIACSNDDKTIEIVEQNITNGAILRTLETHYAEFHPGDLASRFEIDIEEQDEEYGELLDNVEVFLNFIDNTPENGITTVQESKYQQFEKDMFTISNNGLPTTKINISLNDALTFLNLTMDQITCKDQFTVRLKVNLTDERSFTFGNNSSIIIASQTFFRSPYLYFINVVDPIPEDAFIGLYQTESIVESIRTGLSFFVDGESELTSDTQFFEIKKGHSTNTRFISAYYATHTLPHDRLYDFEFTIACDEVIFQAHQYSRINSPCFAQAPIILLGPSNTNGVCNPNDDTVFDLNPLEGYLGFDGDCGFGEHEALIRFSKQ